MLSGRAVELLGRCDFPPRHSKLDCAVSGGKDSLALLVLGVAAGCDVTAYHVDHGLRPGSDKEAAVVAEAAEGLGAAFVALHVELEPGPNLEARARRARFDALPEGVATGHTADDQAETILLNLLRGAGLDGLSGMRRGPRHPILAIRRAEAAALVEEVGLTAVRDESNDDARFLRNRVRHEVLPLLSAVANRDLVPVLCRQAALLADEADLLDELAAALPVRSTKAVAQAPLALARRALRAFLQSSHPERYAPSAAAIERVLALCREEVRAVELEGGHRLARSKGSLVLDAGEKAPSRGGLDG